MLGKYGILVSFQNALWPLSPLKKKSQIFSPLGVLLWPMTRCPLIVLCPRSIFCKENNHMTSPVQGVRGCWLLFSGILQHESNQDLETSRGKKNSRDCIDLDFPEKVTSDALPRNFVWKACWRHLLSSFGWWTALEFAHFPLLGHLRAWWLSQWANSDQAVISVPHSFANIWVPALQAGVLTEKVPHWAKIFVVSVLVGLPDH